MNNYTYTMPLVKTFDQTRCITDTQCPKPKCQWVCKAAPCAQDCKPECEPPTCRVQCEPHEPPELHP